MAEMKIVDSKTKKIRISFKKFQNNPTNQSLLQLYQKKHLEESKFVHRNKLTKRLAKLNELNRQAKKN